MPEQFSEEDIWAEQFPDNVSISALCDCGRHKRLHTHAPPYGPLQPREPLPESDYQSTYKAQLTYRPRSSKRPPRTPRNPNPTPMTFDTNQRTEFRHLGQVERVKPIYQENHYEAPIGPLESQTHYTKEFTHKHPLPEAQVLVRHRESLRVPSEPLDARTTTKETYKAWVPQPVLSFGELPSLTGSILFPERKPLPESTMRYSYQGKFVPPLSAIKAGTPNIKIEGDQVFDTTHNEAFKANKGDYRARPIVPKSTTPAGMRDKFCAETQFKRDFPGYGGKQPKPPRPAEPAPTTINLKFDDRRSFSTENRRTFKGHDVLEHPVPASCKVVEEKYTLPTVKFETETSQKRDYKPINLSAAAVAKVIVPPSTLVPLGTASFDGRTMNSEFFKNWGALPRIRYGDFHENHPYIPPQQPFTAETTTKSNFTPKKAEPVTLFKPVERPGSKTNAKVDYTTSYSEEFRKKQVRMCRAQMYLLQQELKRRQRDKAVTSAPLAKPIAVK